MLGYYTFMFAVMINWWSQHDSKKIMDSTCWQPKPEWMQCTSCVGYRHPSEVWLHKGFEPLWPRVWYPTSMIIHPSSQELLDLVRSMALSSWILLVDSQSLSLCNALQCVG
jgi:hypothetical protein